MLTAFRLLITDAAFLRTFRPLLDPDTWADPQLDWLIDTITTHTDENNGKAPGFNIIQMRLEADTKLKEDFVALVKLWLTKIAEHPANVDEQDYVKSHFEAFLRYRITLHAIRRGQEFLEQDEFDKAVEVVYASQSIRLVDEDDWYFLPEDFSLYYSLFSPEKIAERAIPIGLDDLDRKLAGGVRPKELAMWMAGTGGGKSMGLVMCGAEAFRRGKTVVHFTFENSRDETLARYAHNILGLDSDVLYATEPENNGFEERLNGVMDTVGEGKILVKELLGSQTTKAVLAAILNKLQTEEGFTIDMVIVDYGDYMQPMTQSDKKHERLESVFTELRELAQEFNVVVWTATQTNRLGMTKNKALVEYIGGALGKAQVADVIVAISKETDDKTGRDIAKEGDEPEDQTRRLHLVKLRRSTSDNWFMRAIAHFAQARFVAVDEADDVA